MSVCEMNGYVGMNLNAAQEKDVYGAVEAVEAVAAVAEPTTYLASAAPVSALPIIIQKGRNQVPYI